MRYYYYPLCTKDFAFENIFATESISPYNFYAKRGFGMDYFYKIPKIHNERAIILFNQPPQYEAGTDNTDIIKFIVAVEESALDPNAVITVDEGIIGYQKTIYLDKNNFKIFFFSEKEKRITSLKSETSLPTKGLKKYESNFHIIGAADCKEFNTKNIQRLEISDDIPEVDLIYDRRYNFFKGYIYGIAIGVVSSRSPLETKIKANLQEIVNCFAELKNRYENKSLDAKYARPSAVLKVSLDVYENKLKSSIKEAQKLFEEVFAEQVFSDEKVAVFLQERYHTRFKTVDDARRYLDYIFITDEILETNIFSKIKLFFHKHTGGKNPLFYFDVLLNQAAEYSLNASYSSPVAKTNKEKANENFKDAMHALNKFIDELFLKNTQMKEVDLDYINYDPSNNIVQINSGLQSINNEALEEFSIISNSILQHSKSGKGEAKKQQILQIVEQIGIIYSKAKGAKSTQLYQYLNNEINVYSIDKVSSVVMKNFVAFAFNPDSLEKLESFMGAKGISEKWMGYAFWCGFNGFANTSRNFVRPVFETENNFLQQYLDTYLQNIFLKTIDQPRPLVHDTEKAVKENATAAQNINKSREFFEKFIREKNIISFEEFESVMALKTLNEVSKTFKEKYNITKKESKKIVKAYTEFMTTGVLF